MTAYHQQALRGELGRAMQQLARRAAELFSDPITDGHCTSCGTPR
jgi:hypothetical protein